MSHTSSVSHRVCTSPPSPGHSHTTFPEVSALRLRVQGKARWSTSPRNSCTHFADGILPGGMKPLPFCVPGAALQPGTENFPVHLSPFVLSFSSKSLPEPLENSLEQRSRSHHHHCSMLTRWLLISCPALPPPPTPLCPYLPLSGDHQASGHFPPPRLCTCCSLCTCPPADS